MSDDADFFAPFQEPEAVEEWHNFSAEEKTIAKQIWYLLLDEGKEPRQAEREAAGYILEQRRLSAPKIPLKDLKAIEYVAQQFCKTGMSPEEAEKKAMTQYVRKKKT